MLISTFSFSYTQPTNSKFMEILSILTKNMIVISAIIILPCIIMIIICKCVY